MSLEAYLAVVELLIGALGVLLVAVCDVPKRIRVSTMLAAIFALMAVMGAAHLIIWIYGDVTMFGYGKDVIDDVFHAVSGGMWLLFLYFFVTDSANSRKD